MNVSGLAAEIRRRIDNIDSYQWQQEDVEKMIRECAGVAEGTQQEAALDIYVAATKFAMKWNQTVGADNSYYVTLQQLEEICRASRALPERKEEK